MRNGFFLAVIILASIATAHAGDGFGRYGAFGRYGMMGRQTFVAPIYPVPPITTGQYSYQQSWGPGWSQGSGVLPVVPIQPVAPVQR